MKRTWLFLSVVLLLATPAVQAQYQTLDDPLATSSSGNGTLAFGISGNNIVGGYESDYDNGFLYNGSTYTNIDVANYGWTIATGISGGNIVGWYTDGAEAHGFLYAKGNFTTLDEPNAAAVENPTSIPPGGYGDLLFDSQFDGWGGTFASGVDGDNIVGWYVDANGYTHGFLYNGSTYTTLDDPDGVGSTFAQGISGDNIVGYYIDHSGKTHGFLYNGGKYTTLDDPNGVGATYAQGISGDNIVGWYVNSTSGDHGFLYNGSKYTTLDVPNALGGGSTFAQGISSNTVVGWYFDSVGDTHGFAYNATPGGKLTLTVSASPSGGGTVSGGGTFAPGSSQTVTAKANSGYRFTNWTENGSVVSSVASYTFTLNGNQSLVANFVDVAPPSLTFTAPTTGQRVSNGVFTVTGMAHDNVAVASVYVQVNGNGWVLAGSSNLFTNWSQNVTLSAGSNYVQAYATDTSGNTSVTNGVSVTYMVTGSLQVTVLPPVAVADGAHWQVDNGAWETNGTIISNLLVGSYVVTFKPVPGFKTPTNQTVSISSNLITPAVGTYFDTNPPTSTVVSPTAGQRVSNGVFTVTGTAHDNVAVASVHVQISSTGWLAAGSTNSFTNWTNNVTLSPGTNTLQVYATDTSGNNSLTNGVQFVFVPSAILTVRTNGNGGISPVDNGKLLAIGTNYTLTATAGNNWLFSDWVGGVTTPYAVLTNGANLIFTTQSNLVLQANFVTNPFLAGAGSAYYGLFTPANAVRQNTNSGAITFTYGSTGTVSGTIWLGPDTVNLSSNFDVSGRVRMVSPRHGESNLITTLQLDFADGTVNGQVTDGSFVTQLSGYRDVWTSRNPATNFQGSYTVIIPGTNESSVGPLGTGCGTVTVDGMGNITFSGSLADGTTGLSQHSVVSQEGLWAFYLPLYGGSGSFWAWNLFTNGSVNSLPTWASWIDVTNSTKAALAAYRAGFRNENAQIIGSPYNSTSKPLLALTNGEVILDGGGLAANLTNSILLATNNSITVVTNIVRNTNHLNLSIDKTHGIISGSFTNPTNSNQTISVNGVLLQNLTNAAGYFLGTNQSGAFLLDSP